MATPATRRGRRGAESPKRSTISPAAPAAGTAACGTQRQRQFRGVPQLPHGPRSPANPRLRQLSDADTVRQWQRSPHHRPARLQAEAQGDVLTRATSPSARSEGLEPVSFTRFGLVVKAPPAEGGCGFGFERTPAKRDHYVDVALISAPKHASRPSTAPPGRSGCVACAPDKGGCRACLRGRSYRFPDCKSHARASLAVGLRLAGVLEVGPRATGQLSLRADTLAGFLWAQVLQLNHGAIYQCRVLQEVA